MPQSSSADFLIGTLAYALFWMDESLQASLEAAGWQRMNRTRSMIMLSITAGINRPAQLARNLGVSRQAIHQLLQGMKEEGWLELVSDPSDKRAKVVQFSARSDGIRQAAEAAIVAIETELAERIGNQAVANLKKTLLLDWGPLVIAPPAEDTTR